MNIPDIRPMLAGTFNEHKIPQALWAIEPKIDGIRVMLTICPEKELITYQTRNGNDIPSLCLAHKLNAEIILKLMPKLKGQTIILDAEAVADRDFYKSAGKLRRKAEPADLARLVVFDIPYWGYELRPEPYCLRRQTLEELFTEAGLYSDDNNTPTDQAIRLVPVLDTDDTEGIIRRAPTLLDDALESGFEGVMFKDVEGYYAEGQRSKGWLKHKKIESYDCVICGYTPGKGQLEGSAGALLVRTPWDTMVRVSAGLPLELRQGLYDSPEKYVGLTVELECQEITPAGSLRHPTFVTLRTDK
jgi:ATP-dependent DNA ligase